MRRGDERIHKLVIGAIKSAIDAHSDWQIDRNIIGPIAKRVVAALNTEYGGEVMAKMLAARSDNKEG